MEFNANTEPSFAAPSGAQSVERAFLLLRLIARGGMEGGTLGDLSSASGLARPTAHRLLRALMTEGMVAQEPGSRRYRLGHLAYELGLIAEAPVTLIEACRPSLKRIAAETQDTAYLTVRSGIDGVCLDRVEGNHPIQALTTGIGGRRPLGVGAAGLALLAALPPARAEAVLERNAGDFPRFGGLLLQEVKQALAKARETGFGTTVERITPGVSGIGIAIPEPRSIPWVGLSVAAITPRIIGPRKTFLEDILMREAGLLAKALSHQDAPSD